MAVYEQFGVFFFSSGLNSEDYSFRYRCNQGSIKKGLVTAGDSTCKNEPRLIMRGVSE